MKFSIIMCTWDRANILPKTINSILNQTYEDFELLIMDDGSTDHTQDVLQGFADKDKRIKLFKHDTPKERIVSRKELMKEATGDWIYWVDSDDEIIYCTLEILKHNIELYPDYKMFNFGQIIFSLTGTTVKLANQLPYGNPHNHTDYSTMEYKDLPEGGHYHFDSGLVGTGGFTFKRECLDNIIEIPDITEIYTFADWFGEQVEEWFEKNDPGAPHQKYNQDDKFCGNPWGDDYVCVWLLTRKYKSKKIPINPYIAYIRTENFLHERATISGTMLC